VVERHVLLEADAEHVLRRAPIDEPRYLERVQGYGSVATGEAFLSWTLVVAALSVGPTSKLVRRFGAGRPLLAGLVVMASGLLVLSTAGAGDPYFPTVFVAFLLMGLGAGTASCRC
jgi:MFS family permease